MRLFGPRVLYIDRRRFDFKPQAELPQQQWIVDQDIIPMVTVHHGFYPLPRRPHRCSPLFEPVDHCLRGIAYLKTAYVSDKQRHLARLKVFDVAGEGRVRNNLAVYLRKLGRLDEARQEILRAIECNAQFGHASEPWSTWAVLADIGTDAGNDDDDAEAKHRATASYLAYRRDGGENQHLDDRICLDVTQSLHAGDPAAAESRLQELASSPKLPAWIRPFIQALQAIVAGNRDRTLADTPGLDYRMAAEVLFLLETLEKPR